MMKTILVTANDLSQAHYVCGSKMKLLNGYRYCPTCKKFVTFNDPELEHDIAVQLEKNLR